MAKIKYLHNGVYSFPPTQTHFVKAWKEKRQWVIQVWFNKSTPEGEPQGDWEMPGVFPMIAAIEQSILNTENDVKE